VGSAEPVPPVSGPTYHRRVTPPGTPSGTAPRSLTIDRARHARIVRDLVVATARARTGGWWVGAVLVGMVILGIGGHSWYAAAATGAVVVALQLLVWWVLAVRNASNGLGVGQTVSTEWAADGELVVSDVTGQYHLPRGSVMFVRRHGRNATVWGRSIQFVLPGELLTEDEVAFLEGHAAAPEPVDAPSLALPLSLEVTADVQAQLLADATRTVVRTADFLFGYAVAACFALLWLVTTWVGFLWVAGALLALHVPAMVRFARWRKAFARAFPVGWVLRAEVTPEHLALSRLHGTAVLAWDGFDRIRATDHSVLLRHRRRPFGATTTTVLPLDLFRSQDILQMAAAVGRRR